MKVVEKKLIVKYLFSSSFLVSQACKTLYLRDEARVFNFNG